MFYKLINTIKLNYIYKKKKIKVKVNDKDVKIINLFIKLNIIKAIKKEKNNFIKIYFQYLNNEIVFYNIKNIHQPSKPVLINLKQLLKFNKKNNCIFILSTNKGLLTNFEAEKHKIGGNIIAKIKI